MMLRRLLTGYERGRIVVPSMGYPGLDLLPRNAERLAASAIAPEVATALLDIEPRLQRVRGYRHLLLLREALKRELHINEDKDSKVA